MSRYYVCKKKVFDATQHIPDIHRPGIPAVARMPVDAPWRTLAGVDVASFGSALDAPH
jgi:hypothetical protein